MNTDRLPNRFVEKEPIETQRNPLPAEAIEQAVIDFRKTWGLSLAETCILQQAALGYSDRIAAFRLSRSRSTIGKYWQSIREKTGHDHHRRSVFDVWQRASLILEQNERDQ